MTTEDRDQLRDLFDNQRVLSLAVLVDGAPYVGLLPFAMQPYGPLVHASALAKHTAGLKDGAPFSALVHLPDHDDADPQQIPRITLHGQVRRYPKDSADYAAGRAAYLSKFPQSEQTFALGDFNLFGLVVESARYVAAFGRIYNLTSDTLGEHIRGGEAGG
jgi:putative heme iron utilization protein